MPLPELAPFLQRPLHLTRLETIVIDLPQREPFRSAIGWRHSRRALFVKIFADGAWGIAESSCRPDPYFSHEFCDGGVLLIQQQIIPLLEKIGTYGDLVAALNRIRGWNFIKAGVLDAVHDLWRRQGQADPVDKWQPALEKVPIGISLGLYDTTNALIKKIASSVEQGYRRIKLKIKPGLDRDYLRSVRAEFPDLYVGCDANGSFCERTMEELVALSDLDLAMIEQPFAPDRIDLCADLRSRSPLKVCLDESVAEIGHLHAALRLKALDELNIKPGRVGGLPTVLAMAELCSNAGIPIWIGGMFETGIGRAANLRIAARCQDARAHDLSPSARYFIEDVVADPVEMDAQGWITTPDRPVTVAPSLEKYRIDT